MGASIIAKGERFVIVIASSSSDFVEPYLGVTTVVPPFSARIASTLRRLELFSHSVVSVCLLRHLH